MWNDIEAMSLAPVRKRMVSKHEVYPRWIYLNLAGKLLLFLVPWDLAGDEVGLT